MNREIKFRGKRVDNGEWVYGYLSYNGWHDSYAIGTGNYGSSLYQIIPETVGQFTGLHDKNGNEIYENDILVYQGGTRGILSWNQDDCSFSVNWNDDLFQNLYSDDSKYFEITGNIHDND